MQYVGRTRKNMVKLVWLFQRPKWPYRAVIPPSVILLINLLILLHKVIRWCYISITAAEWIKVQAHLPRRKATKTLCIKNVGKERKTPQVKTRKGIRWLEGTLRGKVQEFQLITNVRLYVKFASLQDNGMAKSWRDTVRVPELNRYSPWTPPGNF